eukprot:354655-Chlamydomonas_euryale.AAC.1
MDASDVSLCHPSVYILGLAVHGRLCRKCCCLANAFHAWLRGTHVLAACTNWPHCIRKAVPTNHSVGPGICMWEPEGPQRGAWNLYGGARGPAAWGLESVCGSQRARSVGPGICMGEPEGPQRKAWNLYVGARGPAA